uniref:Uncharacterized protein n=1 Tax=Setaria viridis TaxID=4556 RepID=A0A4U6U9G4_SETVI|nr:hypothetical protein SEVIR_5G030500v2 [Setaria viridis]
MILVVEYPLHPATGRCNLQQPVTNGAVFIWCNVQPTESAVTKSKLLRHLICFDRTSRKCQRSSVRAQFLAQLHQLPSLTEGREGWRYPRQRCAGLRQALRKLGSPDFRRTGCR